MTDVSVLPNGFCAFSSCNVPGGYTHTTILCQNIEWHESALKKIPVEVIVKNVGEISSVFPKQWAVPIDKGYRGSAQSMPAVVPTKRINEMLTGSQKRRNEQMQATASLSKTFVVEKP